MVDLQNKINCVLAFGINQCAAGESIDLSIELDTRAPQKDISLRWSMPKGATDWNDSKSITWSQNRLDILRSHLSHGFRLKPYRFYTTNDAIWVHCYLCTN